MHINTRYLRNRLKAFFSLFSYKVILPFHTLNAHGTYRATVYMFIILYSFLFFIAPNKFQNAVSDFCMMFFEQFPMLSFGGFLLAVVTHLMMYAFAGHILITYIVNMIYGRRMCYLYWRLSRYLDYFMRRKWDELNKVDVLKYLNMLSIYLLIKASYRFARTHGVNDKINLRYRGLKMTSTTDEAARVLIKSLHNCFMADGCVGKAYFRKAFMDLFDFREARFILNATTYEGDYIYSSIGMYFHKLKFLKGIMKAIRKADKISNTDSVERFGAENRVENVIAVILASSFERDIHERVV